MADRRYDIVVFGATGFVGGMVARYLAASPATAGLRWALGGRDESKLQSVRDSTGAGAKGAGILVADSRNIAAVDALVSQTRIILNTAGPFALYGDPIVDACARHGTHYVDITGETPWIRRVIDRHHETAARNGTRIVPSCGFDSVPSDLGAHLIVRHIQKELGSQCISVTAYYRMYGGFNGGTIASRMHSHESGELASRMSPFALNPSGTYTDAQEREAADAVRSCFDPEADAWVGPFFMAAMNTRTVRRSAALFDSYGEPYGSSFRYQEYLKYGPPLARVKAGLVTGALALYETALDRPRVRTLLKRIQPKPGEGPSEKTIKTGWFKCELLGIAEDGRRVRGLIAHTGDPSNHATTEFVAESALALALDAERLPGAPARGGVLTPSTALGDVLVARLKAAGTRIEIGSKPP